MTHFRFCSGILLLLVIFVVEHGDCVPNVDPQCVCGEANIVNHGRIVNGVQSTQNKYPWMAALFSPTGPFMCGGSVISDKTILTAGHCMFYMKNPLKSTWTLGMHNVKEREGVTFRTAGFQLHPRFINSTYYDIFDIAIAVVDKNIVFNRNIKPICLPSVPTNFFGEEATVAGWGKLNEKKFSPSAKSLMETKIMVKSDLQCRKLTERLVDYDSESMICAFNVNTDACQGDSGGPLFVETEPNRNEIIGTVSFGDGCARDFPGIYGKIATKETINWINSFTTISNGKVCSDPPRSRRRTLTDALADENELADELALENQRKFIYPGAYTTYGVRPYYRNQYNDNDQHSDELSQENQERKYLYPGVYSSYGVMPYYRRQGNKQSDELADKRSDVTRRLLYTGALGYGYKVRPVYG